MLCCSSRSDTIMDCDQLLVLSAGQLREQGPPGGAGCDAMRCIMSVAMPLALAYKPLTLFLTLLQASWRSRGACSRAW